MSEIPPPFSSSRDQEQLKLLEVFHYVMVGLAVGGMAFFLMHYTVMSVAFSHPWPQQKNPPPFDPVAFFHAFRWFYLFMGVWGLASLVANLAAGVCIRRRQGRFFSMVVAAFNCINAPFGTALGVCTLIVLLWPTMPVIFRERSLPS